MSRLTEHTKHFDGKIGYKALGYSAIDSYPFIDLIKKLSDYEDIGGPEELAKVVRCGECIRYRELSSVDYGECAVTACVTWSFGYCSNGRKKEADHA